MKEPLLRVLRKTNGRFYAQWKTPWWPFWRNCPDDRGLIELWGPHPIMETAREHCIVALFGWRNKHRKTERCGKTVWDVKE